MLRFSANLSMLFSEQPLLDRFAAAKCCGFDAVEIQFPYQLPAARLRQLLDQTGLAMVLFNVDADTLLQGGEGLAAVPEKANDFRGAVEQAIDYAELLKPMAINVLPGRCLNQQRLEQYWQTLVDNLHFAADRFASIGVKTVFEAINSFDMPGFIVDSHEKMLTLHSQVAHPNLFLQYDLYHMSRMQQDCQGFLSNHIDIIGHIQFADCPGRGEPGSGGIDFATLFATIADSHYSGFIGAEYRPTGITEQSLGWFKP